MTLKPVRKIGKGRRGNRGRIGAVKAGGRAVFESTLERDFYLALEFDPAVRSFSPQPVSIRYRGVSGRLKPYVPDVLVEYWDMRSPCLFEVKYVADLLKDPAEYRLRFQAARAYARTQGWRFCTVTERFIRKEIVRNAVFLRPFLDPARVFDPAVQSGLLARLEEHGESTPDRLLAGCTPEERGLYLPALWNLIARREIVAALDQPLKMDSLLTRKVPA